MNRFATLTTVAHGSGSNTRSEGDSVTNIGRVLLADDNADMREYAKRLLAQRWLVETVSNGREALEAARVARDPT